MSARSAEVVEQPVYMCAASVRTYRPELAQFDVRRRVLRWGVTRERTPT